MSLFMGANNGIPCSKGSRGRHWWENWSDATCWVKVASTQFGVGGSATTTERQVATQTRTCGTCGYAQMREVGFP